MGGLGSGGVGGSPHHGCRHQHDVGEGPSIVPTLRGYHLVVSELPISRLQTNLGEDAQGVAHLTSEPPAPPFASRTALTSSMHLLQVTHSFLVL